MPRSSAIRRWRGCVDVCRSCSKDTGLGEEVLIDKYLHLSLAKTPRRLTVIHVTCDITFRMSLILNALLILARGTTGRHARNRCPMASRRIPLVLDGDFETQEAHRQKTHIAEGSGSELPNGRRESHLGCTTGNPDRESSGRWSNCGSACVSCSNIRERELRYVTPVRG